MTVRTVARSFGVPPWQIEHPDRPPTEAEVSMWFWRERICQRFGI